MTIRASVADVEFELALAVVLVVLVIFLFLRTLPGTIIPSLSVPLSLVGTLGAMYLARLQPRQSVADGADHRHRLRGRRRHRHDREHRALHRRAAMRRCEAALKGSRQIGFTIISLTVSLIAVLIPLLFMGDVVGRLFHEFAITLAVTIVISAVVSLTLVPMMCAKLLRHRPDARAARASTWRRARSSTRDRALRPRAELGAGPSAADAAGRGAHAGADRRPLCRDPEGILSGPGYRLDPGHHRRRSQCISFKAMAEPAAAARRGDPEGPGRGEPELLHRRRRHQHDAEQRPLPDQSQAARRAQRSMRPRSSGGCSRRSPDVAGVSLYMQPVQDLTIDATVSRTPYHFVLENAESGRIQRMGAEAGAAAEPVARDRRRRQRPAAGGAGGSIS